MVSGDDVALVASLYDLYGPGEVDAMLEQVHPELEVDLTERLPDEPLIHGRDAYRTFLERNLETWSEFRVEVEELIAADDAVVAFVRSTGVGRGSGITLEERVAHVVWLRDGRPVRLKVFPDRDRALEAVGLER